MYKIKNSFEITWISPPPLYFVANYLETTPASWGGTLVGTQVQCVLSFKKSSFGIKYLNFRQSKLSDGVFCFN